MRPVRCQQRPYSSGSGIRSTPALHTRCTKQSADSCCFKHSGTAAASPEGMAVVGKLRHEACKLRGADATQIWSHSRHCRCLQRQRVHHAPAHDLCQAGKGPHSTCTDAWTCCNSSCSIHKQGLSQHPVIRSSAHRAARAHLRSATERAAMGPLGGAGAPRGRPPWPMPAKASASRRPMLCTHMRLASSGVVCMQARRDLCVLWTGSLVGKRRKEGLLKLNQSG